MVKTTKIGNYLFQKPVFNDTNSGWIKHIPFAFFLVETLKPKIFVELGTHHGNSYFAFCQAINELNIPTKAYAVDIWTGDEHAGYYSNEVFERVNDINNKHFSNFSSLLKMSFDEASTYFAEHSVDLLHIDGLHTYEAVKHDYESWRPKMSNKGVVIFHDTNVREHGFGVWKLFDELKSQYPSFEFTHGHGLGTLCVGSNVDDSFIQIINNFNKEIFYTNLFASLGEKVQLLKDVNNACKKLLEQKYEIEKIQELLNQKSEQLKQENEQLNQKNKQINSMADELEKKDKELSLSKHELYTILSSHSWRITRPLRWVYGIIKKTMKSKGEKK